VRGALLNVYEFEVLTIRQLTARRLRLDFAELRDRHEPTLDQRIEQLIPDLSQVMSLRRKLAKLHDLYGSNGSAALRAFPTSSETIAALDAQMDETMELASATA
jgi:hypothetical protein